MSSQKFYKHEKVEKSHLYLVKRYIYLGKYFQTVFCPFSAYSDWSCESSSGIWMCLKSDFCPMVSQN